MEENILPKDFSDWKKLMLKHKFAVQEISTKLDIMNEEFQFIHSYNPIEHIKSRVKSPESIIEKLKRKGYEVNIDNMKKYVNDIAGVRVTCSFTRDIYNLYELIGRQDDVKIIQVKDYIKDPKANGYQSLHMLVEIPVFLRDKAENIKVEIQIRTIAMDFWASLEHKIYYKYDKSVPKGIQKELKECADIINDLDNKMLELKDKVMDEEVG